MFARPCRANILEREKGLRPLAPDQAPLVPTK